MSVNETLNLAKLSQASFQIDATATDGGFPPKSAETRILIRIKDENNHSPILDEKFLTGSILENAPPTTLITRLRAEDADGPPHNDIKFSIVAGERADWFTLSAESGELRLSHKARLDYEVEREMKIR